MGTMRRPYQILAVFLFLFSYFVMRESLKLKYYTELGPGPGFFPVWLSVIMAILAVALFAKVTFRPVQTIPEDFFQTRSGYLRALAICLAWIWAALMLERLGYRLTVMIFFPFLLLTLGRVRWFVIVLFTLLGSLAVHIIFTKLLAVVLPDGPFDFIFEPLDRLLQSPETVPGEVLGED